MPYAREGPQGGSYTNMDLTQCLSLLPVVEFPLVSDCFWLIFSAFKQLSFLFCLELVIFICGKVSPIKLLNHCPDQPLHTSILQPPIQLCLPLW